MGRIHRAKLGACAPSIPGDQDMREVQAKVITRSGGLTLVEWLDGVYPNRAWVTPDQITEDAGRHLTVFHPEGGIPYGVDWSELTSGLLNTGEIENRLKQAGIWTVEELQRQPNVALGVLRAVAGDLLQELLTSARALQKEARI
jgi:hypothetical protein